MFTDASGAELTVSSQAPMLSPSATRRVLPDGVYTVTSLKHGPGLAWDAAHNNEHHRRSGAASPAATGVYLHPPHSEPQQRFIVESIAGDDGGGVSLSPRCCRGRLYLGMRGSSVFLVPRPFAWHLSHATGIEGQFWVSNDRGQRIEVPWSMFSALHSWLSVGAPSTSRRQVFE
jgi:hypothetical protein